MASLQTNEVAANLLACLTASYTYCGKRDNYFWAPQQGRGGGLQAHLLKMGLVQSRFYDGYLRFSHCANSEQNQLPAAAPIAISTMHISHSGLHVRARDKATIMPIGASRNKKPSVRIADFAKAAAERPGGHSRRK